jgi:hypothetical protein
MFILFMTYTIVQCFHQTHSSNIIDQHYSALEIAVHHLQQQRPNLTAVELETATNDLIDAHVHHATNSIFIQSDTPPSRRKLLMAEDDNGEVEMGLALTEPTPECRRILDVWTAKCVFGR